jgi:hypothetical protein
MQTVLNPRLRLLQKNSAAISAMLAACLLLGGTSAAHAASLLENGSFGTDGWSIATEGSGNWFLTSGTSTPLTSDLVAGPANGGFYAVTDATGPGARALTQAFTVPSNTGHVELSFKMFVDSYGGRSITPTLAYNSGLPNQYARVDLLKADASPFDTTGGVIANFYMGSDAGNTSNPYSNYKFNITSLVSPGGSYQIRFADVANQGLMHQGVDAVRIVAEIPEPASYLFFAVGLGLLAGLRRQSRGQT